MAGGQVQFSFGGGGGGPAGGGSCSVVSEIATLPEPQTKTCEAVGGDYCSETGACPPGYDTLGQTSDCNPCCKQGPSCTELGGDYCSETGSCPDGYDSLGQTYDCNPCCQSASTLCDTPPYAPAYWNLDSAILYNNNCYNYSNNVRTDTFAQPGRASGAWCQYSSCLTAEIISQYATNDGLAPVSAGASCPESKTKIALVIWLQNDYHWYRQDADGLWSHKPGSTNATNLDNGGHAISNPEACDRGPYTVFAGYFCTCSSYEQGQGHANIN